MDLRLGGLHHVTAICSDGPRTAAFYRDLGFRLVKKTVNFDDPRSYHLYFGDVSGAPGTLVTFFEWPRAHPGRVGRGTVETIGLTLPREPGHLEDPDGLQLEIHPGDRPGLHHVTVYGEAELYTELLAEDAPLRVVDPPNEAAVMGPGVTHHVAFRVRDAAEQLAWRDALPARGARVSEVLDRKYFTSIYFRMADGVLIEIATDGPGFAVDELHADLGSGLKLPEQYEGIRGELERDLVPIP